MDQHSSTPEGLHYPPEGCSVTRPIAGATAGRPVNDPREPERLFLRDTLKHLLHSCIWFTRTSGQIPVVSDVRQDPRTHGLNGFRHQEVVNSLHAEHIVLHIMVQNGSVLQTMVHIMGHEE